MDEKQALIEIAILFDHHHESDFKERDLAIANILVSSGYLERTKANFFQARN